MIVREAGHRLRTAPPVSRLFRALDQREVRVVSLAVSSARGLGLQGLAVGITRLGNGGLYALLSTLILFSTARGAGRFVLCSTASIALAFVFYPTLKLVLARPRPCDYEPSLGCGVEPLDRYSCPSGHSMTAAAYGVSMAGFLDGGLAMAIALCCVMGWSRVATGHHYATDVLLGWVLGAAIAVPMAVLF